MKTKTRAIRLALAGALLGALVIGTAASAAAGGPKVLDARMVGLPTGSLLLDGLTGGGVRGRSRTARPCSSRRPAPCRSRGPRRRRQRCEPGHDRARRGHLRRRPRRDDRGRPVLGGRRCRGERPHHVAIAVPGTGRVLHQRGGSLVRRHRFLIKTLAGVGGRSEEGGRSTPQRDALRDSRHASARDGVGRSFRDGPPWTGNGRSARCSGQRKPSPGSPRPTSRPSNPSTGTRSVSRRTAATWASSSSRSRRRHRVMVYPKPDFLPATYTILNLSGRRHRRGRRRAHVVRRPMQRYDDMGQDAQGHLPRQRPDIAWFNDPAGNILVRIGCAESAGVSATAGHGELEPRPRGRPRPATRTPRRSSPGLDEAHHPADAGLAVARPAGRPASLPTSPRSLAPQVDRDGEGRRVAVDLLAARRG